MRPIIVYYSMSGNCEMIADRIAGAVGADVLRVVPEKAYPDHGASKFLRGGSSAIRGDAPPLVPYEFDGEGRELVIFGMPVWASRVTPPIRTFVEENADALRGKRFAAFACSSGGGAEKPLARLAGLLGVDRFEAKASFVDPKARPSAENDARLAAFIDELKALL